MVMVDVSGKDVVARTAVAEGRLVLQSSTIEAIVGKNVKKGDVLSFAEAAGLLAIKNVPNTIPHCHPIPIAYSAVEFGFQGNAVVCTCTVKAQYKTGVEMEALAGVTGALLTVWDTVKYLEKDQQGQYPTTRITDVRVVEKKKGGD